MTDTIELFCWLLGDDTDQIFSVEIPKGSSVFSLRKEIKNNNPTSLHDVDAKSLVIWKVSIPIDDDSALMAFVPKNNEAEGVFFLKGSTKLENVFTTEPVEDHIHIIIQPPSRINNASGDDKVAVDIVAELNDRFKITLTKMITWKPPSKSSKSGGYRTFQLSDPIYDGRYVADRIGDTRAPPVQLYNRYFAKFLDDIDNTRLDVPIHVLQATARFMDRSSAIYDNEDLRRRAIRADLTTVLSTAMVQIVNLDKSVADGIVTTKTGVGTRYELAAISIREDKNEIDEGGSDPSTQACLSYGRFWAQQDHVQVRENTCCPTFLLAIAGPWFAVLGAIWTDIIVVHRLTDYIWLGNAAVFNEPSIYRTARIFHALGTNMHRLEGYYQSLKIQPANPNELHSRFFPSIDTYCPSDNVFTKFRFIKPLERESICTTFLAETLEESPKRIVIKFVHRYNADAHKLLATNEMAPKLLYFGKIGVHVDDPSYGDLRMVVMDYVDGITVDRVSSLPTTFRQQVQVILTCLHEQGFVFGDLRGPNVMITKDGKVMFIDCDWIGKHGISRYPITLSQSIKWPVGVEDGLGIMKKEHDLEMLERLVPANLAS